MEVDSFAHSMSNASPGPGHLVDGGQAHHLNQQRAHNSWASASDLGSAGAPVLSAVPASMLNVHSPAVESASSPFAHEDHNMTVVSTSYPFYSHVHQPHIHHEAERLSLNIPSLPMASNSDGSVAAPGGQSPIDPSPHPSTASATLSPITPRSPSDIRPSSSSTVPPHSSGPNGHSLSSSHPSAQRTSNGIFAYGPPETSQITPLDLTNAHASTGFEAAMHRSAQSLRGMGVSIGMTQGNGIAAGISTLSGSTPQMSAASIPRKRALPPLDVSEVSHSNGSHAEGSGYSPVSANHLGIGGLSLAIPANTPIGNGLYKYDDDPDVDLVSSYDSGSMIPPPGSAGIYSHSHPHYEIPLSHAADAEASPVDGSLSTSSGADEDVVGMTDSMRSIASSRDGTSCTSNFALGSSTGNQGINQVKGGSNNFVAKLYQMINDPKSAHFIQWTELGTSFVVSNVGEFSRSILGVHFKHNNFSSFVRQLNMYGFHKINRTPRNQRGPASAGGVIDTATQTWEFSHPKFLRGRPDLLDAIKRKALEPDPAAKARVELPGELAAQLAHMRESQKRVVKALDVERAKVEKLVGVVRCLSDVLTRLSPGSVPPFPQEFCESADGNPSIFVTTPAAGPLSSDGRYGMMHNAPAFCHGGVQNTSPNGSPIGGEFDYGHRQHQPHSAGGHTPVPSHHLRHAQSMHQMSTYETSYGRAPSSSDNVSMEFDNTGSGDRKRQRTETESRSKLSRARSDSVPVGYTNAGSWGRPRAGSGMIFGTHGASGSGMPMPGNTKRDGWMSSVSGQNGQTIQVGSPLANIAASKPT